MNRLEKALVTLIIIPLVWLTLFFAAAIVAACAVGLLIMLLGLGILMLVMPILVLICPDLVKINGK